MSKELTIQEALKMGVGTRFNTDKETGIVVIKSSSEFKEELGIYAGFLSNKFLCWEDSGKKLALGDWESELKFIPIQKPLTFMEAIKSGSRIRVEHELIDNFKPVTNLNYLNDDYLELCCNILIKGGYIEINDLLSSLGYLFGNGAISKILTEGKFYIEGE